MKPSSMHKHVSDKLMYLKVTGIYREQGKLQIHCITNNQCGNEHYHIDYNYVSKYYGYVSHNILFLIFL